MSETGNVQNTQNTDDKKELILDNSSSVDDNKTDLVSVSGNLVGKINYKMSIFLFIVGLIIYSDVFIDNFLRKFEGCVEDSRVTTKGTIYQLIIVSVIFAILDLLIKLELL